MAKLKLANCQRHPSELIENLFGSIDWTLINYKNLVAEELMGTEVLTYSA